MSRGPDAGTALARALQLDAERAGCPAKLVQADWSRWASATFSGARHGVELEAPESPALDRWLDDLLGSDLPIRGHLLADITITSLHRTAGMATIKLEALTVEA